MTMAEVIVQAALTMGHQAEEKVCMEPTVPTIPLKPVLNGGANLPVLNPAFAAKSAEVPAGQLLLKTAEPAVAVQGTAVPVHGLAAAAMVNSLSMVFPFNLNL